jgi:hypothetical protein
LFSDEWPQTNIGTTRQDVIDACTAANVTVHVWSAYEDWWQTIVESTEGMFHDIFVDQAQIAHDLNGLPVDGCLLEE